MGPVPTPSLIDRTCAVEGFGEACLPRSFISCPTAPRSGAVGQEKRVSWRDCIPPSLPTQWPPRKPCIRMVVILDRLVEPFRWQPVAADRQCKREGRALALASLEPDLTAVELDQRLGDAEAQAG